MGGSVVAELDTQVARMRRFNRFYTRRIGVLREGLLESRYTLTEARVLYELAQHDGVSATVLGSELGLDNGYLSRVLRRLRERGLVDRRPSPADGRQSLLSLTKSGARAFRKLDADSRAEIQTILDGLTADERRRLIGSMVAIESLLGTSDDDEKRVPYILRAPEPGDFGYIVHRHGALYAEEYHWDETFEALVAEIVAKFVSELDGRRERCWIAERDGEVVGSVFLVKKSKSVAQLRLLLVEPKARGLGIGARLVDECLRFAKRVGYETITLWTNDVLHAARHIYEKAGFELVAENAHHSFGHDLVGQTWEKTL
jgi:DNA-binding MarR family transcriptional regulator/N-acetylglutamate synthase-like GNAT family acetyltransferase